MSTRPGAAAGFTIVETLICLTVLAILLGLALPDFSLLIQNARVRGEADNLAAALKLARSEAIKRNRAVEFLFTSGAPNAAAEPDAAGANWVVRVAALGNDPATLVDARAGAEGAGPAPRRVAADNWNGLIAFNALGEAVLPAALAFTVGPANNCASVDNPKGVRCLQLVVSQVGTARVCDPALDRAGTDPRRCPRDTADGRRDRA